MEFARIFQILLGKIRNAPRSKIQNIFIEKATTSAVKIRKAKL
jgi:hypothetical protein